MMTDYQDVYLKLKLDSNLFWVKLDSDVLRAYSELNLFNMPAKIASKLAGYKIGYEIFVELKKIYTGLSLCGIDSAFLTRVKQVFECEINLSIRSLLGNKLCLVTNNSQFSRDLLNIYILGYGGIKLPKISSVSGSKTLELIAPFKGEYCFSLDELLVKAYDKSYLKLNCQVLGQTQIIYVNKSIVKHIAQVFRVKVGSETGDDTIKSRGSCSIDHNFIYDDLSTSRAIHYIEKFLSILCGYRCSVLRWSYAKLNHDKYMYHFSFKNKFFRSHVLCEHIIPDLADVLKHYFKLDQNLSPSLDVENKIFNFPIIGAESELDIDQLQSLKVGDVVLCNPCQLKLELGQATILLNDDSNQVVIDKVIRNG